MKGGRASPTPPGRCTFRRLQKGDMRTDYKHAAHRIFLCRALHTVDIVRTLGIDAHGVSFSGEASMLGMVKGGISKFQVHPRLACGPCV